MLTACLTEHQGDRNLLLQKASLLGATARYAEAAEVLLGLNREPPGQPAILKRLVLVFEQLRDTGKASAFLRAYLREAPDDRWGKEKAELYAALGTW